MLFFSESKQDWRTVPEWVKFLVKLGFNWPERVSGQRRIALISMPCDSAAAGLIALGALIRDLGSPRTNDISGHYDSLLRYAHQYLKSCCTCNVQCKPDIKRCGYAVKANGKVHSSSRPHNGYVVSNATDFGERRIAFVRHGVTYKPSPEYAIKYYIDGEPPPELGTSGGAISDHVYAGIVEGAHIIADNLRRSFAGLCLAGRVTGEIATREVCASIRFRYCEGEHLLSNLLTIHEWSSANVVSRMTFYNARTERLDRAASSPALVVSDGAECFLKVLGRSDFQRSDVIGVIHRTVERDKLEDVGKKTIDLRQWYIEDSEMLCRLLPITRGINVVMLRSAGSYS